MYHLIVKQLVRRGFVSLSRGDFEAVVRQFAADAEFSFAGQHALSGELHGQPAVRAWFQRLYRIFPDIKFSVVDVVVNGWPWATTIATRFTVEASMPNGKTYRNRGMQYARLRWGQIVADHLYEDTQRLANELTLLAQGGMAEAGMAPLPA